MTLMITGLESKRETESHRENKDRVTRAERKKRTIGRNQRHSSVWTNNDMEQEVKD